MTDRVTTAAAVDEAPAGEKFHPLSANRGKRRTEIIYFTWLLVSAPLHGLVVMNLSYTRPNDPALVAQALVMAAGTWILPLILRAPEDAVGP